MLLAAVARRFCRQQYVHAEYRQLFFSAPDINFTARLFLCAALICFTCPIRKNRDLPAAAGFRFFIVPVCRYGGV